MKKSLLIILIPLITALSTFLLYGCIDDLIQSVEEVQELKLSSYPSAFKEDTLIVIGKEASEIEKESASFIEENLKESIQTELTIKNDEEILESDKNSNLILIDIPFSNGLLQELYAMTDTGIEKVTSEYPGKNSKSGIPSIIRTIFPSGNVSSPMTAMNVNNITIRRSVGYLFPSRMSFKNPCSISRPPLEVLPC